MSGTTTDFWWTAHAWPDSDEADANAEIVVRMKDHTATSGPLVVSPDPWGPAEDGPGDRSARMPRGWETFGRREAGVDFRTLRGSPLGRTALLVDLETPAASRLELFDLAGRRVRTLVDHELPAGATVVPWDGREDSGAQVRRGVYFARLSTADVRRTIRVFYAP